MFSAASIFPELFESQLVGIPSTLLLDLEADTGVSVSDVDKVDIWQSGNGYNLTQTGTARPALATVGGYPCLQFDGVNDWLDGGAATWLNALPTFTLFFVGAILAEGIDSICKMDSTAGSGWAMSTNDCLVQQNGANGLYSNVPGYPTNTTKCIRTVNVDVPNSLIKLYLNSTENYETFNFGVCTGYTTPGHLKIGMNMAGDLVPVYSTINLNAVRLYSPMLGASERVAEEQALASRYGIVL